MVRSKVTPELLQELLRLYREPSTTAAMLAEQFQVSTSTVARLLRENIPAEEYQVIVAQKRGGRRKAEDDQLTVDLPLDPAIDPEPVTEIVAEALPLLGEVIAPADFEDPALPEEFPLPDLSELDLKEELALDDLDDPLDDEEDLKDPLDEDDLDDEDLDDPLDEDDLDDEDLDDPLDEDDLDDEDSLEPLRPDPLPMLRVLPLDDLDPPEVCYTVIDRFQELTTRPLKDFLPTGSNSALGISPEQVAQAKTLPIFDSHRVARRFSEMIRRGGNQPYRVIQFSGHLLEIVRSHLQHKGITHLLLDGRVYTL